jgi:hypothetical protein
VPTGRGRSAPCGNILYNIFIQEAVLLDTVFLGMHGTNKY